MDNKTEYIQIRLKPDEKLAIKIKAKKAGMGISEFIRKAALNKKLSAKMTQEEIIAYTTLVKYANALQSITNMFSKRDPFLSQYVKNFVDELRAHIYKI